MYTRTKVITPKEATELLKGNTSNRKVSQMQVEAIAQDMKAGNWMLNGESISFSPTGKLLNGQHRLHACIMAGVSFETVVAYDVPEETFSSFDNTKPRKASDAFGIEEEEYPMLLQTTLNMVFQYENGTLGAKAKVGTTQQTLELAKKHSKVRQYVALGNSSPYQKTSVASALYITHVLEGRGSYTKCEEFVNGLQFGENLKKGSPIKLLRDKMFKSSRWPRRVAIGLVFSAVQSYLSDKTLEKLKPISVPSGHEQSNPLL